MSYRLKRQAGLTLVELMIATTLSLVLLAGVLLVFSANKTTYQMQGGLGTLQENGRYAVRQITSDLQMAGFGGCLSPRLGPRIVILENSPPSYLTNFSAGDFFTGIDGAATSYGGTGAKTSVAGTDSIEIRGPLRSSVSQVSGETLTTGNVTTLGDDSGFAVNDALMISDCGGGEIFRASGVSTSGGNTQVAHASSNLSRRYASDSVVTELTTHTYFIADTLRTNTTGQPILALYRFDGDNTVAPVELVDGVEDLQIEYALDTDADGRIDAFGGVDPNGAGTAMTAANWNQVMAVRVSLLMNSVDGASSVVAPYTYFPASSTQITPTNDFRLRQEFTAMVSVRNSVL